MAERVHKFLTKDYLVRASVVKCTGLISEVQQTTQNGALASVALGRALVGTILMSANLKEQTQLGVYFRGNGPLGVVYAEASYEGICRGYVKNPQVRLDLLPGNRLNIPAAIGSGFIEVVRTEPYFRQSHTGRVEIVSGEIGSDLGHYMHTSHQIPSVIGLTTEIHADGSIAAAGGFLLELMPGSDEDLLKKIESAYNDNVSLTGLILQNASEEKIISEFFPGLEFIEIAHRFELKYQCKCSVDRIKNALLLLSHAELMEVLNRPGPVEVTCDFCNKKFALTADEVQELQKRSYRNSLN